jgi:hypothetical protein
MAWPRSFGRARARLGFSLLLVSAIIASCRRTEPRSTPLTLARAAAPVEDLQRLVGQPIGDPGVDKPLITQLTCVDLDRDGKVDVVVCDARANAVTWLRQIAPGQFAETVLATDLAGPVHTEAVDLDGDGDLDLLVASIGQVFPDNRKIGAVVILENDGQQHFTKHVVLENVARVTDVRAGDFDGDGRLDLAVAQFGYDQGEIRWMRNLGGWKFESHNLLNLSGTINVCVADLNADGKPDIVALVSQQWEEIHLFENDGSGNFADKVIFGSANPDFGSSGISLCDLNRDGKIDILYTNGDGFDYAEPGSRPWHGVQWLENGGDGFFRYHRIGDLPGAYSPVGVDLDSDGAVDVVAVSGFNDWKNPAAASLVMFHNDGKQNFTPQILAHVPTHLITCAAADLDGSGRPSLVTGGFHAYPPYEHLSRVVWWRRNP